MFLTFTEAGLGGEERFRGLRRLDSMGHRLASSTREDRSVRTDGNSVDLEREIVALTETQLQYSTLSTLARRYFQGLRDVIREGR